MKNTQGSQKKQWLQKTQKKTKIGKDCEEYMFCKENKK